MHWQWLNQCLLEKRYSTWPSVAKGGPLQIMYLFTSLKFYNFASVWEIEVAAGCLCYPKSNGLPEWNVQTVKQSVIKAQTTFHTTWIGAKENVVRMQMDTHSGCQVWLEPLLLYSVAVPDELQMHQSHLHCQCTNEKCSFSQVQEGMQQPTINQTLMIVLELWRQNRSPNIHQPDQTLRQSQWIQRPWLHLIETV